MGTLAQGHVAGRQANTGESMQALGRLTWDGTLFYHINCMTLTLGQVVLVWGPLGPHVQNDNIVKMKFELTDKHSKHFPAPGFFL